MTAVLFGVFAAVCWSFHDLLVRSLAPKLGPFRLATCVMLIGAVLLVGFVLVRGTIWTGEASSFIYALLLGVAYGFAVGGLYKGFSLAPVSIVGPLTAGYPALVVIWGLFNGLSPAMAQWIAIAVILLGTLIVSRSGTPDGGLNAIAPGKLPQVLFFCLISSLGFAASVVLGQRASIGFGEMEATFVSRFTAAATLIPFLMTERHDQKLGRNVLPMILVMAVLDVAGVVAINASGAYPDKEFAAMGISTYGATSVVLAMLILKEKVSWGQWLGIAMIIGSVIYLAVPV